MTDSGGIQEETTTLGIPCFTIRDNTERPITVEMGTNTLVGTTGAKILDAYRNFKAGTKKRGQVPELWDGRAAARIINYLVENAPSMAQTRLPQHRGT
jgi:UDP-N-acetylglucosamine 2-epimerase (non-hydrolysing)